MLRNLVIYGRFWYEERLLVFLRLNLARVTFWEKNQGS